MPTMPALNPQDVLGTPREALPRHVAIIMDGNGRWAQQRGLERIEGHRRGAETVRKVVTQAARLGLECLTLYSFSLENWRRPVAEVNALMALYAEYLVHERETIRDNDVRMVQVGRREGLPEAVVRELDATEEMSAQNQGMTLALALNYGSRAEIVDAVRDIARKVADGSLRPDGIDEAAIERHLYTAGLPEPDLLVRTAGEMRISNFLLWQISYAEFYVTPVLWPDFAECDLNDALVAFAQRERRFGRIAPKSPNASARSGA